MVTGATSAACAGATADANPSAMAATKRSMDIPPWVETVSGTVSEKVSGTVSASHQTPIKSSLTPFFCFLIAT
jgi:hypothetical protein